jgi:3D (Asp-Asp-Asp) domain-containing protein
MNQFHSPRILALSWKRMLVALVLASYGTMSMPLKVVAAEAVNPEPPVVMVAKPTVSTVRPSFTIPAKASVVKMASVAQEAVAKVVSPAPARSAAQVTETGFAPDKVREETTGYEVVRVYKNVPSTAYTSRPEETDDTPFIAADGTHVYDGMVAANFLKFKTKIRIPELYGDKIFTVHDRMNKRYNVKVDIWMDNLQKARQHGVRTITVEVVEEVKDKPVEVAVK